MAAQPKQPRAWQRMLSGRRLDLLDPSPLDVEIEDIAHGLARVARWNGQTQGPCIFSVAQHSLLVDAIAARLYPDLSAKAQLHILLHDAPEYVIGDMITPFKAVLGDDYRNVEARLMRAVHLRFGLPAEAPTPIKRITKRADQMAAFFEATRLAGFARTEALAFFGRPAALSPAAEALMSPWSADEAKQRFLARFAQAIGETDQTADAARG